MKKMLIGSLAGRNKTARHIQERLYEQANYKPAEGLY